MPNEEEKMDVMIGLSLQLAELDSQFYNAGAMANATIDDRDAFAAAGAASTLNFVHHLADKIQQAVSTGVLAGAIDPILGSKASSRVQRVSIGTSTWMSKLQAAASSFPEPADPTILPEPVITPESADTNPDAPKEELDPMVELALRALFEDLPMLDDL